VGRLQPLSFLKEIDKYAAFYGSGSGNPEVSITSKILWTPLFIFLSSSMSNNTVQRYNLYSY
jgi:hypothetical protein